jgi:serine/threonine protein kinase
LNVSITEKFKFLSEEESRKLFRQILLGVEYLHENGIAHRGNFEK